MTLKSRIIEKGINAMMIVFLFIVLTVYSISKPGSIDSQNNNAARIVSVLHKIH